MLPTASTKGRSGPQARPSSLFPHYLRRIVKMGDASCCNGSGVFSGLELAAAGASVKHVLIVATDGHRIHFLANA